MKPVRGVVALGLTLTLQACLPGDVSGPLLTTHREVVLEFQAASSPRQPAAHAPARPDTEIFLAPLKSENGRIDVGQPVNISRSAGYDNQPFFTPDGAAVLFTSVRGGTQSDIYRYDIATSRIAQVTNTPESEYSPTIAPSGHLSVVRVELDKESTQRLWQFTADGRDPRLVFDAIKPVGYHAWADDHRLALFVLGTPSTLQVADTRTGAARIVASDVGRSLQPIPGGHTISFVRREKSGDSTRLLIEELNPETGEARLLTPAVAGSDEADVAWTPDGTLLMARGEVLYAWRRGDAEWKQVAALDGRGLAGVSRIAVSPKGDRIALVGTP
jgi:WD40 repeat protein